MAVWQCLTVHVMPAMHVCVERTLKMLYDTKDGVPQLFHPNMITIADFCFMQSIKIPHPAPVEISAKVLPPLNLLVLVVSILNSFSIANCLLWVVSADTFAHQWAAHRCTVQWNPVY